MSTVLSVRSDADAADKWDRRWTGIEDLPEPAFFVVDAGRFLPEEGSALDVAGGIGRHALWMARRGLSVTLVDKSPAAVDKAVDFAVRAGLPLDTEQRDLEAGPLPEGPWDLVLIHHYLDRSLLESVPSVLSAGGVLVFCQPTMRNLERHDRPGREFLLEVGEIGRIAGGLALDVLFIEESWGEDGRHEGRLVARSEKKP